MEDDLRKRFQRERERQRQVMGPGHEERFLKRLELELPVQKRPSGWLSPWWGIAASLLILVGLSLYFFKSLHGAGPDIDRTVVEREGQQGEVRTISLGDLSPDFKKIETYYTTHINLQLSDLVVNNDNRDLIDGYMEQLGTLDREYQNLNRELNELGPNDQTIGALVRNLQIRLELLQKLKTRMEQLKSSKNEQESFDII